MRWVVFCSIVIAAPAIAVMPAENDIHALFSPAFCVNVGSMSSVKPSAMPTLMPSVMPTMMTKRVAGQARTVDGRELVYTEDYYVSHSGKQREVIYRSADKQIFFSKILDYSNSKIAPDYIQIDWRNRQLSMRLQQKGEFLEGSISLNEEVGLKSVGDPGELVEDKSLLNFLCADSLVWVALAAGLESGSLSSDAPDEGEVVVDAGFDEYVKQNWQELRDGVRKSFAFLPAGRDKPVAMEIRSVDDSACTERAALFLDEQANDLQTMDNSLSSSQGTPLCLQLRPQSFIVKALMKPIYLNYSVGVESIDSMPRLLGYFGLTNIKSDNGKSQSLHISYRYLY